MNLPQSIHICSFSYSQIDSDSRLTRSTRLERVCSRHFYANLLTFRITLFTSRNSFVTRDNPGLGTSSKLRDGNVIYMFFCIISCDCIMTVILKLLYEFLSS